jgi:hypothetical protein
VPSWGWFYDIYANVGDWLALVFDFVYWIVYTSQTWMTLMMAVSRYTIVVMKKDKVRREIVVPNR